MSRSVLSVLCCVAALAVAPSAGRADDFYKGRTVSVIVGASPGGGYDAYARIVARFMPAHIPGHPVLVVQNMPGAGNLGVARAVNATQAKDGTIIAVLNSGVLVQSVVQPEIVQVDFRKYAWVGDATPAFSVCYGYGPKGVASWDDLMNRPRFIVGSTAKGSLSYISSAILREIFAAPIKLVLGYPGSSEVRLAVERGELDGDCGDWDAIPTDWPRDGKARMFVRFTKEALPDMPPAARFVEDFAKTQDQKDALTILDAGYEIGRPFVMSGEVPAALVAIMQKAFDETMADPAFLAEAGKERLPIFPMRGADAAAMVDRMMNVSPAAIAEARKVYE